MTEQTFHAALVWAVFAMAVLTFVSLMRFKAPYGRRTAGKSMPIAVVGTGFAFNAVNAYVNARFISEFAAYGAEWLGDPRFLGGLAIFAVGLALNVHSDNILLGLRRPGGTGYSIPRGGAFHYVSCPNYLGELLEWCGWAVATWSLGGLAFFTYTTANLVPRALSHHRWYQERFADYPTGRKAVVPGVLSRPATGGSDSRFANAVVVVAPHRIRPSGISSKMNSSPRSSLSRTRRNVPSSMWRKRVSASSGSSVEGAAPADRLLG